MGLSHAAVDSVLCNWKRNYQRGVETMNMRTTMCNEIPVGADGTLSLVANDVLADGVHIGHWADAAKLSGRTAELDDQNRVKAIDVDDHDGDYGDDDDHDDDEDDDDEE